MVRLPTPDKYDGVFLASTIILLSIAYVFYPVHVVKVSIWLVIFTMYVGWMAYTLYKLAFDEKI